MYLKQLKRIYNSLIQNKIKHYKVAYFVSDSEEHEAFTGNFVYLKYCKQSFEKVDNIHRVNANNFDKHRVAALLAKELGAPTR